MFDKRVKTIAGNRVWEHTIRDDQDYAAHFDYIHFNPVKHGLVADVADWPYSSFHRAVAMGIYPGDWGGGGGMMLNGAGEAWDGG